MAHIVAGSDSVGIVLYLKVPQRQIEGQLFGQDIGSLFVLGPVSTYRFSLAQMNHSAPAGKVCCQSPSQDYQETDVQQEYGRLLPYLPSVHHVAAANGQ